MTGVPPPTLYHRWLGWHAPAMRRAITVLIAGLIVAVVLLPFITWGLALVGGWNAAALTFLLTTWSIIIRADSSRAPQLAAREDQTEGSARVLLVGASVASLLGAGYALHLAGAEERRTADAADRRRRADRGAVVDRDQHRLHPALRRPALPVRARRHRVRRRRRPATSRLPRLRLRRLHHRHDATRCPTPRCATPRSGARCSPMPSCPMCSASSSSQARSTSSPDCSGNPARPTAPTPARRRQGRAGSTPGEEFP